MATRALKPPASDTPTPSGGDHRPERLEGGDLVCAALAERGVERIFSVSGGPINSIYHGTRHTGIHLVHTRHEAAAGFMADATARLTGIPGVCAVTLGPGVTNTVTSAITAQMASVPILIIGGQAATSDLDRGAGMSVNALPVMASVTKWSGRVPHTDQIPEYVDRAWRHMLEGRPGPVFLEIPSDILGGPAGPGAAPAAAADRHRPTTLPVPRPARELVDSARLALASASRPILIVGDDAYRDDAGGRIKTFVERHGVPFYLARMARGVVDERHPLSGGVAYTPANPSLRRALAESDCIILLGHFFEFDLEFGRSAAATAMIIQTSVDSSRLGENRSSDVAMQSGPSAFLDDLGDDLAMAVDESWVRTVVGLWTQERADHTREAERPGRMHPIALIDAVTDALPEDTIYVSSHGNVDFWADARIQMRLPGHYLRAGQSGALGAEIPFGIGAKLARPGQPVVIFVGDGGFGYHGLELDTAARYDAPVIVVIGDDGKWGAIAAPQARRYGTEVEMDLPERDWVAFARAIGGEGFRAEDPVEVRAAVRQAIASGKPSVIHAPIVLAESPYMRYISSPR